MRAAHVLRQVRVAAFVVVLVLPTACSRFLDGDGGPVVTVGSGSTVEQGVLAALAVEALEGARIEARVRPVEGGTRALRVEAGRGDVDVFWDYTGAAWALGLGQQAPVAEEGESYDRVAAADAQRNGFTWLAPTRANATLALFVRAEDLPPEPERRSLTWLSSELAGRDRERVCLDADFVDRPAGLQALAAEYAIALDAVEAVSADEERAIRMVAAGRCFAGLATATSGVARNAGLVPLADELRVFPAFVVAPVVRAPVLEAVPGVAGALEAVAAGLDTAAIADLNAQVEAGADPATVAREALVPDDVGAR